MPPLKQLQKLARLAACASDEAPEEAHQSWLIRRRLSDADVSEIVQLYESGVGTPQLCRDFELSKYSVLKLLRAEGVQMRRQPLSASQRRNAVRLYHEGETIDAVAAQLSASYSRVREAILDAGVPLRPAGRRRAG